jgi:hypothetical protein
MADVATLILFLLAVLGVLALAAFAFVRQASNHSAEAREASWMPEDLAGAKVLLSEPRPLRAHAGDVQLVAKPDRAYMKANGWVQLVELKDRSRHVVYDDDVIELSAQRVAVEGALSVNVESEGIVVTQMRGTGSRRVHRVPLLLPSQVQALAHRYLEIVRGETQPIRTANR